MHAVDHLPIRTKHAIVEKFKSATQFELGESYERTVYEGNLILDSGLDLLFSRLIVSSLVSPLSSAYTTIGVGDSSVAEANSQTDLQATTNKAYQSLDLGYPTQDTSAHTLTYRATFNGATANFAWNEWVIYSTASRVAFNRKVQAIGTKTSGQVWTLTITLSR